METNTDLYRKCQALLEANPYAVYNGVTLEHVEYDSVGVYTVLKPEYTNIYGMAHGGLISTLLDNCAGLTVRLDGKRYVTLDMNVCFFANVKEGKLHARSRVIKRGKTITVMNVQVTSDDGKLLAEATVTFFRIGDTGHEGHGSHGDGSFGTLGRGSHGSHGDGSSGTLPCQAPDSEAYQKNRPRGSRGSRVPACQKNRPRGPGSHGPHRKGA